MNIEIRGQRITMLPEKALTLMSGKILVLADLHFGKINHFRKSGIPVPPKANDRNSEFLIDLLNRVKPDRVIFLGDLFHSHYNEEWEVLGQVLHHFSSCQFELVKGNHDIMSKLQYERHKMKVHEGELKIGPFVFTHEPQENPGLDAYNIAGHIHPGVHLSGKGKQSLMLPCFYFGAHQGIMPAFGSFTGLARIRPKKNDQVFVIAESKILKVDQEQI
ncbi:MAG: ligase-associated DNA damage response endonuclease PdeM [Bacteroidia bacterium]|nr:ligase-associated DNA damage response endonuclease PdeM [Bacteroidia bacterium]